MATDRRTAEFSFARSTARTDGCGTSAARAAAALRSTTLAAVGSRL